MATPGEISSPASLVLYHTFMEIPWLGVPPGLTLPEAALTATLHRLVISLATPPHPPPWAQEGHREQRVIYFGPLQVHRLLLPAVETWGRSPSSHLHHIVGTHGSEKSCKPTAPCSSLGISRRTHRRTFQSTGANSEGRAPPSGWPCWKSGCKSGCWRTLLAMGPTAPLGLDVVLQQLGRVHELPFPFGSSQPVWPVSLESPRQ